MPPQTKAEVTTVETPAVGLRAIDPTQVQIKTLTEPDTVIPGHVEQNGDWHLRWVRPDRIGLMKGKSYDFVTEDLVVTHWNPCSRYEFRIVGSVAKPNVDGRMIREGDGFYLMACPRVQFEHNQKTSFARGKSAIYAGADPDFDRAEAHIKTQGAREAIRQGSFVQNDSVGIGG